MAALADRPAGDADPAAPPPRRPARRRSPMSVLIPVGILLVILGGWYLISYVVLDPGRRFLMPPPHTLITDALLDSRIRSEILAGLGRTTVVALLGLAVAIVIGVAWGVIMTQARWAERGLFPYAVILQCIPILALVPLIGFWFGFGFFARVLVCILIALFPMVSNTLFGLQSVERGQLELFQLQQAGRATVLFKLRFPAALPAIFAGMRISAGLSVVGAIVGDFFFRQGKPGLGIVISNYQSRLQSAPLFAAILVASLLGFVIFALFGRLRTLAVGRWYDLTDGG